MNNIYKDIAIDTDLNIVEKEIINENVESINAITGDTNHLYKHLKLSCKKALSIDIIVSFLMESGVKLIIND